MNYLKFFLGLIPYFILFSFLGAFASESDRSPAPIIPLPPSNIPESPPMPQLPQDNPLNLPISPPSENNDSLSGSLTVTSFEFKGNTVFNASELGQIKVLSSGQTIASSANQTFSFAQLLEIANSVAQFYFSQGYKTSGAVIYIPQETQQTGKGIVQIKILEGKLEQIKVKEADSDDPGKLTNYIQDRLGVDLDSPLNVDELLEALQLLQLDPLIEGISAKLSKGTQPNSSILTVDYRPANSFSLPINLNNGRSPSVGSFQREIGIKEANLSGLGDTLSFNYINTDGSNAIEAYYQVPLNADNGTLKFEYNYNSNWVIEPPFNQLNISSKYQSYELSFRQPILRSINNQSYQEFALGLMGTLRHNQASLLGIPYPLSPGADTEGKTRIFSLSFFQDFTQQNSDQVFALRSQFNFGIDAFNSTINSQISGVEEIPDSRFFIWRGQGQYVKLLAPDTLWVVRSDLQFANRTIVPIEQFSLGGLGSVLGYRQNQLLTDNGFFIASEVRVPLLRISQIKGVLQIIPFVNYGVGWNTNNPDPINNNLASVGLGLLWQQGNNFSARIDWGIPLIDVANRGTTWQENGIYFTIQYNPF